jgi:hypothetical protein
MRARRESPNGEGGFLGSAILTTTAVVCGNALVFALAAAVLIPPPDSMGSLVAPMPTAPPAESSPSPAPAVTPVRGVTSAPAPGLAATTVLHVAAPVRVAARTTKAPHSPCAASSRKIGTGAAKVARARSAATTHEPDGV